jgi:hypothetical protein
MLLRWRHSTRLKRKVKAILRPTVNRPACPGIRRPSGTRDKFFFNLYGNCIQTLSGLLLLGTLSDVKTSLICSCCWASPAQPFSGPRPAGLMILFYSLNSETPPSLEDQVPVCIFLRNRLAQLCLRKLRSVLVASYDSQGYGGGILTRHERPPWREGGSLIYSYKCYWTWTWGRILLSFETGFPFSRYLLLAELQRKYSNSPPHKVSYVNSKQTRSNSAVACRRTLVRS